MTIPAKVSAARAIAHSERHEGELAIKLLPRLVEMLPDSAARLQVVLEAGDIRGCPRLRGRIKGTLPLVCRRCGKPYDWSMDANVDLRLVRSDSEERQAMTDSEPYRVEHDELALREIVEEEVLLALPLLPRCESCETMVAAMPEVEAAPAAEPRRDNPFAALKKQLKL